MTDRLIYAEKLKAHYSWWAMSNDERTEFKRVFDTIINLQPTVEAPRVVDASQTEHLVRCQDRRFYQGECCRRYGRSAICRREPNDFCSKGEPRND